MVSQSWELEVGGFTKRVCNFDGDTRVNEPVPCCSDTGFSQRQSYSFIRRYQDLPLPPSDMARHHTSQLRTVYTLTRRSMLCCINTIISSAKDFPLTSSHRMPQASTHGPHQLLLLLLHHPPPPVHPQPALPPPLLQPMLQDWSRGSQSLPILASIV